MTTKPLEINSTIKKLNILEIRFIFYRQMLKKNIPPYLIPSSVMASQVWSLIFSSLIQPLLVSSPKTPPLRFNSFSTTESIIIEKKEKTNVFAYDSISQQKVPNRYWNSRSLLFDPKDLKIKRKPPLKKNFKKKRRHHYKRGIFPINMKPPKIR